MKRKFDQLARLGVGWDKKQMPNFLDNTRLLCCETTFVLLGIISVFTERPFAFVRSLCTPGTTSVFTELLFFEEKHFVYKKQSYGLCPEGYKRKKGRFAVK